MSFDFKPFLDTLKHGHPEQFNVTAAVLKFGDKLDTYNGLDAYGEPLPSGQLALVTHDDPEKLMELLDGNKIAPDYWVIIQKRVEDIPAIAVDLDTEGAALSVQTGRLDAMFGYVASRARSHQQALRVSVCAEASVRQIRELRRTLVAT